MRNVPSDIIKHVIYSRDSVHIVILWLWVKIHLAQQKYKNKIKLHLKSPTQAVTEHWFRWNSAFLLSEETPRLPNFSHCNIPGSSCTQGWSIWKRKSCALDMPVMLWEEQDWAGGCAVLWVPLKRLTPAETKHLPFCECSHPRRALLKGLGSLLIRGEIGNPSYRS